MDREGNVGADANATEALSHQPDVEERRRVISDVDRVVAGVLQLAAQVFDAFYVCGVCIFGCASSTLVWGRMAALLMRLTQGTFDGLEVRLTMYVDDILLQAYGTS